MIIIIVKKKNLLKTNYNRSATFSFWGKNKNNIVPYLHDDTITLSQINIAYMTQCTSFQYNLIITNETC